MNESIAKNQIVKKFNYIKAKHAEIQREFAMRKDNRARVVYQGQKHYKIRHALIVALFNEIDSMRKNSPEMWQEAVEMCKEPRDISGKIMKGKEYDLEKEFNNMKSFYIEKATTQAKKPVKSKPVEVKKENNNE